MLPDPISFVFSERKRQVFDKEMGKLLPKKTKPRDTYLTYPGNFFKSQTCRDIYLEMTWDPKARHWSRGALSGGAHLAKWPGSRGCHAPGRGWCPGRLRDSTLWEGCRAGGWGDMGSASGARSSWSLKTPNPLVAGEKVWLLSLMFVPGPAH